MKWVVLLLAILAGLLHAGDDAKIDPRYSFRTDTANASLSWYQPSLLEFPPLSSAHCISGELVNADFIHRSGQFRTVQAELKDFNLLPYGSIIYSGAEADLRDLPLGTHFTFFLYQDTKGDFTRLATMREEVAAAAGAKAIEDQRKKFIEFTKKRGVPGWVDKTDGNQMVVTLFSGDAANFKKTYMGDIVAGRNVNVVVANDELRTWNPPTDNDRAQVVEIQEVPQDCYGNSGVRLVLKVANMLEGFRKGRIVRIFGAGWPMKDPPFGESLMGYGYGRLLDSEIVENTAKEYPVLFPFRTDYGNGALPWYRLKPGELPPPFSEHVVIGEWVKAGDVPRTGQIRVDRSGESLDFSVIPDGSVKYLGADASLADIPAGMRCWLNLYQDEHGAFTKASLVRDEFSFLVANAVTYRIETVLAAAGKLIVARQLPEVKNYNGDMEKPADIARMMLLVGSNTRIWKREQAIKIEDLKPGDSLLVNVTGELPGKPSNCTDIWVGDETHKMVIEAQKKKHSPEKKSASQTR